MKYAPVIIPTMNRYNHFYACLESLERCTGSEHTDVYVALDYPPSEKYVDGWKDIDKYLLDKEKTHGFHSLTVYRRTTNYFFSGKGNASSVIKELRQRYEAYIFSEDDNVFAPCFLEYINKGLEIYKDDERVLAICGYSHPCDFSDEGHTVFAQSINYSAWGTATWYKKSILNRNLLHKSYFRKVFYSPSKMLKVMQTGWSRVLNVIDNSQSNNIKATDYNLSLLMLLNKQVMIMPVKPLVRNMGWDDSATHTHPKTIKGHQRAKLESQRELCSDTHFEYVGAPFLHLKKNNQRMIDFGRLYTDTSARLKLITIAKLLLRFVSFWK